MLRGIDAEFNAYRHLWEAANTYSTGGKSPFEESTKEKKDSFGEEFNAVVADIAARLEKVGISITDARSFARQAIAAYPDIQNRDILLGYAMALYKATTKKES